jgi:hypothetical protein
MLPYTNKTPVKRANLWRSCNYASDALATAMGAVRLANWNYSWRDARAATADRLQIHVLKDTRARLCLFLLMPMFQDFAWQSLCYQQSVL